MSQDSHWRDTARTPRLWIFDGTVICIIPAIFMDLFTGLRPLPTVLIGAVLVYYVLIAVLLKMTLFKSLKWLMWTFMPKKRPSRRPVFIRESYDIMGIGSWRLTKVSAEGDRNERR